MHAVSGGHEGHVELLQALKGAVSWVGEPVWCWVKPELDPWHPRGGKHSFPVLP